MHFDILNKNASYLFRVKCKWFDGHEHKMGESMIAGLKTHRDNLTFFKKN